jgi:hypothetical protein
VPDRRLVVLLSALLLGVLVVGVGTALNRTGDDGGTPKAGPTTQPPFATESPTDDPTAEPTVEPTGVPTEPPAIEGDTDGDGDVDADDTGGNGSGDGSGDGSGGDGSGAPDMPNTGAPAGLALAGVLAACAAAGARRIAS